MPTDKIEIPDDTSRSRLRRSREATDAGENPDDIGSLDARIAAFYVAYPQGRIYSRYEWSMSPEGVFSYRFRVEVFRLGVDGDGARPDAVGHGARTQGEGEIPFADYAFETAESVALGRALRFLGITGAA